MKAHERAAALELARVCIWRSTVTHKDMSVELGGACRLNKRSFHPSLLLQLPFSRQVARFPAYFLCMDEVTAGQFQEHVEPVHPRLLS